MAWTTPRTWVTGELLTSGTLNTHIRDNERYLHGDDGPITLLARLNVPELYIDGLKVDPTLVGTPPTPYTPGPIVTPASALSGTIPVGPAAMRLLMEAKFATIGQRYLVLGRAAIEAVDANDLNQKAEVYIAYVSGASPVEQSVLDVAFYTIPSGSASPTNRDEVTLFAHFTVPEGATLPHFRLAARKSGGTGGTVGYGISLKAYPI